MTQRILHGKLKELESILTDALLKEPENHSRDDIKQKLAFVGSLLSAEVASSSPSSSSSHPSTSRHHHYLRQASQRLASLENVFRASSDSGNTFGGTFFSGEEESDEDSGYSSEGEGEGEGEGEEGVVDDDTDDLIVFEGIEKLFPDLVAGEEKAIVEFRGDEKIKIVGFDNKLGDEDAEEFFVYPTNPLFDGSLVTKTEKESELEREEERRVESGFGKRSCCAALGGGILIGMFMMGIIMVNLSGCFHYVEPTSFFIPT